MKLLLLSAGVALGYSGMSCDALPKLAKACRKDYDDFCSNVDESNLIGVLQCAKANQASLSAGCTQEIAADFSADYACASDLSTYCPSFGQMSPDQWDDGSDDNDDDDDDDDDHSGKRPDAWRRNRDHPPRTNRTRTGTTTTTTTTNTTTTRGTPVTMPTTTTPEPPATNGATFTFTFGNAMPPAADPSLNALGKKNKPQDPQQCFLSNYAALSASCRNAIAQQWAGLHQGEQNISEPTADEAYAMMAPPSMGDDHYNFKKMNKNLFIAALALFVCAGVTCLCCCCRRCKKRRAERRVVAERQEVALTPLPEAVVVSNAGPTRYVPLATPVSPALHVAVRPLVPTYIPYTGEGLGAYIPTGQPVHV